MLLKEDNYIGEPDYDNAVNEGKANYLRMLGIAKAYGIEISDSHIIEIGCHLGAMCYSFSEAANCQITGTEYTGYKVSALDSNSSAPKLDKVSNNLANQRSVLGKRFRNAEKVTFIEDDICNSTLPSDSYNLVISFDVLEHLHNPGQAFIHIKRILKKGGIAIHDYNPFFSLNGGHSLCTLDFPWGHCMLSKNDFERYIKEIRPEETEIAITFYNGGLNRMTHTGLEIYTKQSGLQFAGFIKYAKEQHVRMVNHEVLKQSQANYPDLTIADLVTPKVVVIQKK